MRGPHEHYRKARPRNRHSARPRHSHTPIRPAASRGSTTCWARCRSRPREAPDQWTQAVINRPLTGGDRLWADRDGRGELHVGSTAVRLGAAHERRRAPSRRRPHAAAARAGHAQRARARARRRRRRRDRDAGRRGARSGSPAAIASARIRKRTSTRVVVNFGQAEVVTPGADASPCLRARPR